MEPNFPSNLSQYCDHKGFIIVNIIQRWYSLEMTRSLISAWYNVNLSMKDTTRPGIFSIYPVCLLVQTKLNFSSHRMCGYFLLILAELCRATYLNRLDLNMKQPLVPLCFTNIRQIPTTGNHSFQVVFCLPSSTWTKSIGLLVLVLVGVPNKTCDEIFFSF